MSFKESRRRTLVFHLRPEPGVGGDGGGSVAEEEEQEKQRQHSQEDDGGGARTTLPCRWWISRSFHRFWNHTPEQDNLVLAGLFCRGQVERSTVPMDLYI